MRKFPDRANSRNRNDTLIVQNKENRSYRHSLKPRQPAGAVFNYDGKRDATTHTRRIPVNTELFRPILTANKKQFPKKEPAIRTAPKTAEEVGETAGMNLK